MKLKQVLQENTQSSKMSMTYVPPEEEFKQWKKHTLERFIFHLKKVKENNKHQYLNIKN